MSEDYFNWPESSVEILRRGHAAGESASRIAYTIAREFRHKITRNMVIGKADRLGLPKRKSSILSGHPGGLSRLRRKRTFIFGGKRSQQARACPDTSAGPMNPPPEERKTLLIMRNGKLHSNDDLDRHSCRYPIGDPGEPGFAFCGRHTDCEPYCDQHASLCGGKRT